jgi:hypothetical protein
MPAGMGKVIATPQFALPGRRVVLRALVEPILEQPTSRAGTLVAAR